MAVIEISITPLGTADSSVSTYVAGCLQVLAKSRLKHQLTPMGTVIEGNLDEVFPVLREMMEAPFSAGAGRVSTLIKIDDRRDRPQHTMEKKVRTVENLLKKGTS